MRAMAQATPELVDRHEVQSLRVTWPAEAFSPFWHVNVTGTVGAHVLLCLRVPTAAGWMVGWAWAEVVAVRRFRLLVE
jgi:hypothetical protein